ncbi:helix-turn-helix domain-containing protein [Oceanobacillus profundus]|uniref:Helix-turn-helix domain-containing protein n=1 Tax=Oceanobacillus profundus TaxID=372463 RepID=A0A417YKC6_9BACI|nr:helix-turn-helix domain-containing protein [Oceanobacillus profundus]MDO6451167.1 helix-turn-helix domain-containing protein [Oceanobacillus profundus]RHW33576.1 helix-turn-helix domain-containing protein [Oceanobacillus profundus]
MDVGAKLKEARLASGLSLDSLQETTKIQKRYLVAIEEGNLHILPGKFYARAFIKEYANAVGLNPNELVEEHKEEIPSTEEENVQYTRMQRTRKENQTEKSSGGISSLIPTIIVVLLIVGIVFVAWWFIRENMAGDSTNPVEEPDDNVIITNPNDTGTGNDGAEDEADGSDENTNDEENEDETQEESNEQSDPEFTVTEEGTGSQPVSTIEMANAGEKVIITLESADPEHHTWLEIREEGGEAFYNSSFSADESPVEIDISDAETISFNVGYAPALKISINGVELEYPVDAGQYVHQRLNLSITR